MSRVGKKPIEIPEGVEVKIEGREVKVSGPKGEISLEIRPEIEVSLKEDKVFVAPKVETKRISAFWGLSRTLIANMVKGVTEGYQKQLEIRGLGYKANMEGQTLVLQVGFTHPVKIEAPPGINISVEKNIISVSGVNKNLVGQTASKIRKVRPPEPYKGKGIRYLNEVVRRKAGKKVVTAGGS